MSNVQRHLYQVASELDSMNMGCLHPRKNFYYHYSVFPAQLLKLLFLHLSHLFTLGRPGSRAGGWHITRPEAHGDLSTWLRCPGSRSTSSWTLALVKVSPELGTGTKETKWTWALPSGSFQDIEEYKTSSWVTGTCVRKDMSTSDPSEWGCFSSTH